MTFTIFYNQLAPPIADEISENQESDKSVIKRSSQNKNRVAKGTFPDFISKQSLKSKIRGRGMMFHATNNQRW